MCCTASQTVFSKLHTRWMEKKTEKLHCMETQLKCMEEKLKCMEEKLDYLLKGMEVRETAEPSAVNEDEPFQERGWRDFSVSYSVKYPFQAGLCVQV